MMPQPPSGQGPIDPRGAFSPPPPPGGAAPQAPPPPQYPPPMMMPPMPPPMYYPAPPRGGFARAIFITLATTIFGISLVLNIYLLALTGLTRGEPGARADVLVSGDPRQKVAVLSVNGFIGTDQTQRIEKLLKQIEADPAVKALVVEVNSPGGEVTASDQIYHRLLQFKREKSVPVVATMGSLATSGGYYISCAADEIFAQPTTLTGNIGVVWMRFDLSGTLEKLGARETSITPGDADFKNLESMFKPETPEATAYLRELVDDMYARFKHVVSEGRSPQLVKAGATVERVADGRVYTANEARRLGLVDELGYPPDAYTRAAELAGISNATVVRYDQQPTLLEALTISSGVGSRGAVSISFDPEMLRDLATPRLMYFWTGD